MTAKNRRCPANKRRPALRCRSAGLFALRTSDDHGTQLSSKPFERLNTAAVQNAAALRYQAW